MATSTRRTTPVMTDDERERLAASAGVDTGETPSLSISAETVCAIIFKAREFDVKDAPSLSDDGSDPPDEEMRSVLEDRPDDPVWQELVSLIGALSFDEQVDLVTLMWIGRGDGSIEDWHELRDEACRAHNARTAHYLLGTPLLSDYLAEGLAQFGRSCTEFAGDVQPLR